MLKVILITLLLFLTDFILPQVKLLSVSGFITDSVSGVALSGTNILVYTEEPTSEINPYYSTSANNFGFYILPKLKESNYFIVFKYLGYRLSVKELDLLQYNTDIKLNIQLIPENIKLEEVVVEGKKVDKNVISTIDISPETLTKLPSLSGELDLFRLLQLLPGINKSSEVSNGLYVRGGSPDQTLVLVDGAMIYNPSHIGNIASTFNSNALSDIKLIKGAFPAEYGGRLSSVLDIKLKAGTKERETQTLGLGTVSSFFAIEGPINKSTTYMFAGRWMYYDALQRSFDKYSSVPRYNFYDVNGKMSFTTSESSALSVNALYSSDNMYSPNSNDIDYEIQWKNLNFTLNWIKIDLNSWFLNSTISYTSYDFSSKIGIGTNSTSSPSYYSNPHISDIILRQTGELNWAMNQKFKTGVEVAFHNYDLLYNDYYDEIYEQDPYIGKNINSTEAAFFIQNESYFFNSLNTNLGGRFVYFHNKELLNFEPRISVSYEALDDFYIKGAAALSNQFIHLIARNDITLPTDLWYPATEKIEPSNSLQFVFGLEKYFYDDTYNTSAEFYYRDMNNLYEFKNAPEINPIDDSIEDQFVKGKGEAYGLELFFQKKKGDLQGWIGYTLSWTERKFDALNGGKVFYPKYDRRNDLSIAATYNLNDQLSFGATFIYASGLRYTISPGQFLFEPIGVDGPIDVSFNYGDVNTAQFPPYHKLDLNCNYLINLDNLNINLYVNFYNVYNRKNTFAQYLVVEKDEQGNDIVVVKRISLFPFIPMAGVVLTF